MNPEDQRAYEVHLNAELKLVSSRALGLAQVQDAISNRTAITLTCPWGHRIVTAELDHDEDRGTLGVRPIADVGRAAGSAVRMDAPWGKTSSTVCMVSGCGKLIKHVGWCDEHGGREALDLEGLSSRFTCKRCSPQWSDRVTTPRLIQVITTSLFVSQTSVSVTGRVAAGPSRRAR